MTIEQVDKILSQQKRVFNFENDLVLHFALSLIKDYEVDVEQIYFEKPFLVKYVNRGDETALEKESYTDLLIIHEDKRVAFEFKFQTSKLEVTDRNNVVVQLKNQSANDTTRFGFRKDIYRLEQLAQRNHIDYGFAVLLTNDKNLFKTDLRKPSLDFNYRFTNQIQAKDLGWKNESYSPNHWTRKGEKNFSLHLSKDYPVEWKKNQCEHPFWYCIVEVARVIDVGKS